MVPIGKAKIARAGNDVTIVSWSMGMTYALKAADELAKEGIDAEVIDLRTMRPMDTETIVESVMKTGRCVVVEEGWPQSGVGAEIAARVMEHAFDYLDAPVARVSSKDVPMPYAANLEKLALPSGRRRDRGRQGGLLPVAIMASEKPEVYEALAAAGRALASGGTEILRAGIIDGETVRHRTRAHSGDPAKWGDVLSDLAKRIALIYSAEDTDLTEAEILTEIAEAFAADLGAKKVAAKPKAVKRGRGAQAGKIRRTPIRQTEPLSNVANAERARTCPSIFLCPRCRQQWKKAISPSGSKRKATRSRAGDVIAEIETDKATMEVEAVDEGTLAKIVVAEGTADVPVNQLIAVLAGEGEDVKSAASGAGKKGAAPPGSAAAPATTVPAQIAPAILSAKGSGSDPSTGTCRSTAGCARQWPRPRVCITAGAPSRARCRHRYFPDRRLRPA